MTYQERAAHAILKYYSQRANDPQRAMLRSRAWRVIAELNGYYVK